MTDQYSGGGGTGQQRPPFPGVSEERRPSPRRKLAIAALVLGGLSVLCCGLTGVPAIVVGLLALTSSQRPMPRRFDREDRMAVAGAGLGAVTSLVLVAVMALASPDESNSAKEEDRPDEPTPSASVTATPSPTAESSAPSEKPTPKAVPKVKRYRVLKVLDPATVVVGFRGQTTVRIIGIEAPRRNPEECFGRESLQRARALLDGKRVELTFESPPRRDARGQLLAQLTLAHGRDYGVTMLDGGYAAVSSSPGLLATDYRDAMTTAKAADAGLWASCARLHTLVAPPQPDPPDEPEEPASNCDPNYSPCIPAYPPDINCPEAGPVTVTGPDDPHDLDGDGDGVACGSD